MDVLRTGLIGAALLPCLLTPSSPTAGEPATCSATKYCGYFWPGAHVDTREPRVLEVNLHGGKVEATRIREAITELALDDLAADEILLTNLVVKDGSIDGSLELDNLIVPFGLRFESLSIPAVEFRNMEFRGQLTFTDVRWHHRFYAGKSEFQRGLEFTNGTRFENHDRSVSTVLQIDKSSIERDMLISRTIFFGNVELYNNRIAPALRIDKSYFINPVEVRDNKLENLDIYNTSLNKELKIFSNDIERLEIKSTYVFGTFNIDQNSLRDYVKIGSVVLMPKHDGPGAKIVFANNEISKEFQFSADYISSLVDEIELVGNAVRGRALLEFPSLRLDWGQESPPSWLPDIRLNLENSSFESVLQLRLHEPFEEKSDDEMSLDIPVESAKYDSESGHGEAIYCYSLEKEGLRSERLIVVDFGSARIARLAWDLPTGDCRYQWRGSDFRYERWIGSEEEQENWIYQLAAPQPSTIYYVAEQLRAEGRFDRSRDLFLEAKRISYEPRSEGPYQTCSWTLWPWQAEACARQYTLYWYLTASGFGVKPEFTVLGLSVTWAVGFLVYVLYSQRVRSREAAMSVRIPASERLDRPVDRITDRRGQETGPSPGRAAGLQEEAPAFRHRQPWRRPPGRAGTEPNRPPAGFALHQEQEPKRFSLSIFSLDATLPVINLHAYDSYYPESFGIQLISYVQHVFGWILVSSLIASLAVL